MNHLTLYDPTRSGRLKKLEAKYKSKLGFKTSEGIFLVHTDDILFLQASGNYTQVSLINGQKILISKTLKVIEALLPDNRFRRCHNSFVINLEEVAQLSDAIILSSGDAIPISRRKRNEIKEWFADRVTFI